MAISFAELLKKYDVPVPRYTSYPTVPSWKETPTAEEWFQSLKMTLQEKNSSWSMYLHLPFCESLCTFCGCNTIITKDHSKAHPYVEDILKEWSIYLKNVPELAQKPLKHIHLGGGTPTFLSPQELEFLISSLFKTLKIADENFEASIEVDPRRTTNEQLNVLKKLGFNRVSLGVQDFNSEVQRIIHREQPFEMTKAITDSARELGYHSVNFDLIYGLPLQTKERLIHTVQKTLELKPDRIAFYSFALVPWIKPAQRLFKDTDLPSSEEKRELYEIARLMFLNAGYRDIGMDHFALETDSLYTAYQKQKLHRNFMGYTDQKSDILLGLGISSISETPNMFHQNEKLLPKYQEFLINRNLPTHRGHKLSIRDQEQRLKILQIMTQYRYQWKDENEYVHYQERMSDFLNEKLVVLDAKGFEVTDQGHPFLRNICALFDEYIPQVRPDKGLFSKSI